MKKNVASQAVGAQMVSASDGSAFTGAVTVYVTGDAGTQAAGSVGAGACTHEGNGFHTYAPAQAETNYDHVAFTFVGTGAVPATVQIYTSYPQTGDNYARLGAPAGASVSADVAAVKAVLPAALVGGRIDANVGAISADAAAADNLEAALDGTGGVTITAALTGNITGNLSGSVGSVTGAVGSVTGAVGSVTGAVGSVTGNVGGNVTGSVGSVAAGGITASSIAADAIGASELAADAAAEIAAAVRTELTTELARVDVATSTRAAASDLSTVAGYLDTEIAAILADTNELQTDWANGGRLDLILDARASQTSVDDLPTNAELATALGTADDAVLAAIAALPADLLAEVLESGFTVGEILRILAAVAAGKTNITDLGGGNAEVVFRDVGDTKDRVTADMTGSERTTVTLDGA